MCETTAPGVPALELSYQQGASFSSGWVGSPVEIISLCPPDERGLLQSSI